MPDTRVQSPEEEHENQAISLRGNFLKNRQTRSIYTQNTPVKIPQKETGRAAKYEENPLFRTSFGYRRKTELPINTNHPLNLLTKEVKMRQAQISEFNKMSASATTAEWKESEMYQKVGAKLGDQLSIL